MNWFEKISDDVMNNNDMFCFKKISELQSDLKYTKNELEELNHLHNVTIKSFKDLNMTYNKLYNKYIELKESILNNKQKSYKKR